jgi:putative flippase GtrA
MSGRFGLTGLGALAVLITTYLALTSGASPGLAALAITSAQALVQSVYWLVSSSCDPM